MIRIEAIWLGVAPLDMRAGTETMLARVVAVFGEARPHQYIRSYGCVLRKGYRARGLALISARVGVSTCETFGAWVARGCPCPGRATPH